MDQSNFGKADYIVFVAMLLISSAIGLYFRFSGGRQKTASEFLFADGQMTAVPLAFSLMASFMSAITLLGLSAENYSHGTMFVVVNISYAICTPIAAYLFMPVYFNLGVFSAFEYLDKRFGRITRISCSIAYTLQSILYMAVALYAPALALEAVTGMPKSSAIITVGLVCTFYSTIGGLKAVIFTDIFQSILMFAAIFSVIYVAWVEQGSLSKIWHIADEHGRIEFGNFDFDPTTRHSWWSLIIGGGVTFLSVYAVNQGQIQRYLSAGNLKTAQKSLWLNLPILSLLSLSTSFAGIAIFSKYAKCDPFQTCRISKPDQLMPHYVVDTMQHIPGLSGLFVSGIFSAALSTVSAAINSLAAVTLEDYIRPLYRYLRGKDIPGRGSLYAKLISVAHGLVCIGLAFLADHLGGVLQASLTILGVVGGPTLGLFCLGMFFPAANQMGALGGYLTSLGFTFWLGFSEKPAPKKLPVSVDGCAESNLNNATSWPQICSTVVTPQRSEEYFYLQRLSYLWLCVLGLVVCLVVGNIISYLSKVICGETDAQKDPCMFSPPIASFLRRRRGICAVNRKMLVVQSEGFDLEMKTRELPDEENKVFVPQN